MVLSGCSKNKYRLKAENPGPRSHRVKSEVRWGRGPIKFNRLFQEFLFSGNYLLTFNVKMKIFSWPSKSQIVQKLPFINTRLKFCGMVLELLPDKIIHKLQIILKTGLKTIVDDTKGESFADIHDVR